MLDTYSYLKNKWQMYMKNMYLDILIMLNWMYLDLKYFSQMTCAKNI